MNHSSKPQRLLWFTIDWWLVAPALVLLSISLLVLSSQSVTQNGSGLWRTQLFAILLGAAVYFLILRTLPRWWNHISKYLYIVCILLLVAVLLWGVSIGGAKRWLSVGGVVNLQITELMKFAVILVLSGFLSARHRSDRARVIGSLLYGGIASILIGLQPDLGNALIMGSLTLVLVVARGVPFRYLLATMMFTFVAGGLVFVTLHDYQRQRIVSFINPSSDSQGANYNVRQAQIAIGSGGILGSGINGGSQSDLHFLPTQTTDFVFAVVAEKLGIIGAITVVVMLSIITIRIWWLAKLGLKGSFEVLCMIGIGWVIAAETTVNVFMNLGASPVTGIQLPFVSYGGTHVVMELAMIGFVIMLSHHLRGIKQTNTLQTAVGLLP